MKSFLTVATLASGGCLLLAACSANDGDPGPGGVTAGEAKALDEAAEMLDERSRSPADASAADLERRRIEADRAAREE